MGLCFAIMAMGIIAAALCMACGWDKRIWAAFHGPAEPIHNTKAARPPRHPNAPAAPPEQEEWRKEFGTTNMAAFEAYARGNALPTADERIHWYSKAIQLDPDYVLAYNARGLAYREKGDYDSAIADHRKAIELDPRCAHAYNSLALAYWSKGDHAHTREVMRMAGVMGLHNAASHRLLERLQKVPIGWIEECRPAHVH